MKIKIVFTLLVKILLFGQLVSQSSLSGYYIREAVKTSSWTSSPSKFVLEFVENRFYSYDYPLDAAGHLVCRTGTYLFCDTIISLKFDTSISISLNTGTLTSKHINCDPMVSIRIQPNKQKIFIGGFPGMKTSTSHSVAIFDDKFQGIDWAKKFFVKKPHLKTVKCRKKKRHTTKSNHQQG